MLLVSEFKQGMRKASKLTPFLALLLVGAVVVSASIWLRAVETPPWSGLHTASLEEGAKTELSKSPSDAAHFEAFTFLTYNVRNWLVSTQSPVKSTAAKQAVIHILVTAAPDVIGLCEIGSREDVVEIQLMLKAKGMDFPHIHYTGGTDPIRHLALLSRFPIVTTETPDPRITGTNHTMPRGILDATARIGGRDIRFLGLHLKSKRTVPEYDEAVLRIEEAGYVRKYIDTILEKDHNALLLAYGDLNDTTGSLSTRTICGTYHTPGYMNPIHTNDSRRESWTHHYAVEDSYTRIDFVTVSQAMKSHVKRDGSRVIDDPLSETASDHRAVVVRFE